VGSQCIPLPDATHTDPIRSGPIRSVSGSERESDTQTDIRIPTKSDFFIIVAGQPMDEDEINK